MVVFQLIYMFGVIHNIQGDDWARLPRGDVVAVKPKLYQLSLCINSLVIERVALVYDAPVCNYSP